jgi:hypothetical protein
MAIWTLTGVWSLATGFVVMALITLQDAFHPIKVAESLLYLAMAYVLFSMGMFVLRT